MSSWLVPLPEPFEWVQSICGLVLRCRRLQPVAPNLFTTRGVPLTEPDHWRCVAQAVGADHAVTLQQVHGREVVVIRQGSPPPVGRPVGDVLVSNDPSIALAVRAADCVPLLLADQGSRTVAAVHAGWRGVAAGAIGAAIDAMAREFGTRAADVHVAIGPSIGACCYEVGSELVDAFAAAGHPRQLIDRWFHAPPLPRGSFSSALTGAEKPRLRLDLVGASRDQLVLAGIPERQIYRSGLCTAMHLEVLTSYRAEQERAGRMAGVIRCRA